MPKDPSISSFKIGDMRRPAVRQSGKPGGAARGKAAPPPEDNSVGFPAVESRLEGGSIESVAAELQNSYETLEEMSTKGDMRSKAAAKKAMSAYERTADLFEYLFATKEALANPGAKK